jgi:cytidylate kinase
MEHMAQSRRVRAGSLPFLFGGRTLAGRVFPDATVGIFLIRGIFFEGAR